MTSYIRVASFQIAQSAAVVRCDGCLSSFTETGLGHFLIPRTLLFLARILANWALNDWAGGMPRFEKKPPQYARITSELSMRLLPLLRKPLMISLTLQMFTWMESFITYAFPCEKSLEIRSSTCPYIGSRRQDIQGPPPSSATSMPSRVSDEPIRSEAASGRILTQVTHLRDSFRNFRDRNIVSEAFVGFLGRKADVVKTRPLASR